MKTTTVGYVCIAQVPSTDDSPAQKIFFGPRTNVGLVTEYAEPFETNGGVPFETSSCEKLEHAKSELANLYGAVAVALIIMGVLSIPWDEEEEINVLKQNLMDHGFQLAIMKEMKNEYSKVIPAMWLIGPMYQGRPTLRPCPAARLSDNHWILYPARQLDYVIHMAKKVDAYLDQLTQYDSHEPASIIAIRSRILRQ